MVIQPFVNVCPLYTSLEKNRGRNGYQSISFEEVLNYIIKLMLPILYPLLSYPILSNVKNKQILTLYYPQQCLSYVMTLGSYRANITRNETVCPEIMNDLKGVRVFYDRRPVDPKTWFCTKKCSRVSKYPHHIRITLNALVSSKLESLKWCVSNEVTKVLFLFRKGVPQESL